MSDPQEVITFVTKGNGQTYVVRQHDVDRVGLENVETGIFSAHRCETCGCTCQGLEPVYDLPTAAAMLLMSDNSLSLWLSRNKPLVREGLYMKRGVRKIRVLALLDICRIREIRFNPWKRGRTPYGLAGIIVAANKLNAKTAISDIIRDVVTGSD